MGFFWCSECFCQLEVFYLDNLILHSFLQNCRSWDSCFSFRCHCFLIGFFAKTFENCAVSNSFFCQSEVLHIRSKSNTSFSKELVEGFRWLSLAVWLRSQSTEFFDRFLLVIISPFLKFFVNFFYFVLTISLKLAQIVHWKIKETPVSYLVCGWARKSFLHDVVNELFLIFWFFSLSWDSYLQKQSKFSISLTRRLHFLVNVFRSRCGSSSLYYYWNELQDRYLMAIWSSMKL